MFYRRRRSSTKIKSDSVISDERGRGEEDHTDKGDMGIRRHTAQSVDIHVVEVEVPHLL
jgi:hypothetical protein